MKREIKREIVYNLIDEERDYQDQKWGGEEHDSEHTIGDWLMYIEDYVNEGKHLASRSSSVETYRRVCCILRKITALGVSAMEQHIPMSRNDENFKNWSENRRKDD